MLCIAHVGDNNKDICDYLLKAATVTSHNPYREKKVNTDRGYTNELAGPITREVSSAYITDDRKDTLKCLLPLGRILDGYGKTQ